MTTIPGPTRWELVGDRRFVRILAARTVSVLGTSLSPVAFAFAVLSQPGAGPGTLGVVLGAQALAEAVMPLLGGALADRVSRSGLMAACDGLAALSTATVAVLFATGSAQLPVLVVLAAVNGISSALFFPALSGLVPQTVTRQHLQAANGLLRLGTNAARIAGPVLGGIIVTATAPTWGLAVDALTFAVSAALIVGVRAPAAGRDAPRTTLLADLRHGWREFTSRTWLWTVVAAGAVMNMAVNAAIVVLGPVIARHDYHGPRDWSAVLTALAVGMVAGALVAVRIRTGRPLALTAAAFIPLALPFALLAARAPIAAVVVAAGLAGLCLDVVTVMWDTVVQSHIPAEVIGRVTSYDMVGSFALAPLGLLAAGPVATAVGAGPALAVCAALIAASGLAALAVPSVRRLTIS